MAGNIWQGGFLVLSVILIQFFVAYLETGATNDAGFGDCHTQGNITTCQSASTGSFLGAVLDVSITGIDNAPTVLNVLYVVILGGLLVLGVALIVLGIASVPFGGG